MTKIALITDTHFGARGNHLGFLNYFERFFDEIFFPYLEEHNIRQIFHLGDLVDNRNSLNYLTATRLRRCFLEKLSNYNVTFILGNHDSYHKNTNEINVYELIKNYFNITVYTEPCVVNVINQSVLFLPWINSSNHEQALELIENVRLDYCFGHLELYGFDMSYGSTSKQGLDPKMFDKFSGVYTGHYHHKSSKNNIHYLGAPYEMTWIDYNDPKGFHVLDMDTGELEFIKNPHRMFHMIHYDDTLNTINLETYNKKYLKVYIKNSSNNVMLDMFLDTLEKHEPYNIQIISNPVISSNTAALTLVEGQDTISILKQSMNDLPSSVDKEALTTCLLDLHEKANLIEV